MSETPFHRILTSDPVDRTAARVMRPGIHWEPKLNPGCIEHWKDRPPTLPAPRPDLTGTTFGRFTIVGYLGRKGNKTNKARWLARCACGAYEARRARTIRETCGEDMCIACRAVGALRTGRAKTETTFESIMAAKREDARRVITDLQPVAGE